MRLIFLIIPAVLLVRLAGAQTAESSTGTQGATGQTAILDYQSVYEASTVEEEVKMAAERFNLTPAQQEVWLTAALERRETEKQVRAKFETKAEDAEKNSWYRGLRSAQNTFHEIITGHLSPAQKQAVETDRLILQEKQRRIAKIPPPPPVVTPTVAPVDSTSIKQEIEAEKAKAKKAKKKRKAGA